MKATLQTLVLILFSSFLITSCVKKGCMDPRADNYAEDADKHNSECEYSGCLQADQTCRNGGTCNDDGSCDCRKGFYGKYCQNHHEPTEIRIDSVRVSHNEFNKPNMRVVIEDDTGNVAFRSFKIRNAEKNKEHVFWQETFSTRGEIFPPGEKIYIYLKNTNTNRNLASMDTVLYQENNNLPKMLTLRGENKNYELDIFMEYYFDF